MGFTVSAYFVRGVLIDTAFRHVAREVDAWVAARRPHGAILTHYHEDHSANAELLAARGVPLGMAPATEAKLRAPERILWYRRWCWGEQPPVTSRVEPFAHPSLEMIHTPGHSSEHHVVWDAERETVFGGDLFLGVKVRISHPWPREDVRAQVASLRRVAALRPARYFDGHRGLVPNPVEQLAAKADWMEETIGRADALIARGLGDDAIVRALFGREDRLAPATFYDYSRRNWVASVRATAAR